MGSGNPRSHASQGPLCGQVARQITTGNDRNLAGRNRNQNGDCVVGLSRCRIGYNTIDIHGRRGSLDAAARQGRRSRGLNRAGRYVGKDGLAAACRAVLVSSWLTINPRPNSNMPKTSTRNTGSITANSTAAAPLRTSFVRQNLQHSRVIGARGLKLATRQHFATGIMSYLASPFWLFQLIVGIALVPADHLHPPRIFQPRLQPLPGLAAVRSRARVGAVRTYNGDPARTESLRACC